MLKVVVVQVLIMSGLIADEEQRNDAVIDDVLVVSRDYELYLMGLELDYSYDDFEPMFKFNNPKSNIFLWLWYYHSQYKNYFSNLS